MNTRPTFNDDVGRIRWIALRVAAQSHGLWVDRLIRELRSVHAAAAWRSTRPRSRPRRARPTSESECSRLRAKPAAQRSLRMMSGVCERPFRPHNLRSMPPSLGPSAALLTDSDSRCPPAAAGRAAAVHPPGCIVSDERMLKAAEIWVPWMPRTLGVCFVDKVWRQP